MRRTGRDPDLRYPQVQDDPGGAAKGERGGVVSDAVGEGTPAARAGFQPGDIVMEFDGERVRSARQFTRLVRETPPGRSVTAVVRRAGAMQTLTVAPEARRIAALERLPEVARDVERRLGRLPRDLNFDFDFDFDLPRSSGLSISGRRLGVEL